MNEFIENNAVPSLFELTNEYKDVLLNKDKKSIILFREKDSELSQNLEKIFKEASQRFRW